MAQPQGDLLTTESSLPDGRAVITRRVDAPPGVIWSVLADGWMYATWVVGTSRIRAVDPAWPNPGSRLHHSAGIWPALIDDHTEVLAADPGRELTLNARGWPAGEATVRIHISPGTVPGSSTVRIVEDAVTGPGTLLPRAARQLLISRRNTETLRRLAFIAEGRPSPASPDVAQDIPQHSRVS